MVGNWLYQDIICRWAGLCKIVTDNVPLMIKAAQYIVKWYHIHAFTISIYNSRANGIVERLHFDVHQAMCKAADGDETCWSQVAYSVFWAERITICKHMGCSPYFAATGTHLIIPLNISEATYLQPPPDSVLSTTDLIVRRAIALQKWEEDLKQLHSLVFATWLRAAIHFEQIHAQTLRDYNFKRCNLVLQRNSQIEYALDRKLKPRYLGPLIVISRNKGGAYILCKLDGTVLQRPIAAFRLVPYFSRTSIFLPPNFIDISGI